MKSGATSFVRLVLEVAGVAAIEGCLCWFDNLGACLLSLTHDVVDLVLRGDVVAKGELQCTLCLHRETPAGGQAPARPKRQLQPGLEIEERDSAILELGADDALRTEAKAISVEGYRTLEVADAQSEQGDVRIHRRTLG